MKKQIAIFVALLLTVLSTSFFVKAQTVMEAPDELARNEVSGQVFSVNNRVPTCENDVINGQSGINGVTVFLRGGLGETYPAVTAPGQIAVNGQTYTRDGLFRIQYPVSGVYDLCVDSVPNGPQFYCSNGTNMTVQCKTLTLTAGPSAGHRFGFIEPVTTGLPHPTAPICKKSLGDADCNGTIDLVDYYYYVRQAAGGAMPNGVSADFNGVGGVNEQDRAIIVSTLTGGPAN